MRYVKQNKPDSYSIFFEISRAEPQQASQGLHWYIKTNERLSGSFRRPRDVVMDAGDIANGSVWSTTPRTCLPRPRRRAGAIVGSL